MAFDPESATPPAEIISDEISHDASPLPENSNCHHSPLKWGKTGRSRLPLAFLILTLVANKLQWRGTHRLEKNPSSSLLEASSRNPQPSRLRVATSG
jgi:hypothetical protein